MSVKQDNMSALLCKFTRRHPQAEAPKCNLLQQKEALAFAGSRNVASRPLYHPVLAQVTDACALFLGCAKVSRSSGRASATALGTVSHNDAARARSEFCRLPCFCPIQPQNSGSAPAIVCAVGTRLVLIHPNPGTTSQTSVSLCLCSGNKRRHGSRIRIRTKIRIKGPAGSRQRVLYAPQLSRCINPPKTQFKLQSEILIARGQPRLARLRRPRWCCGLRPLSLPHFSSGPDLDSHFTSKRRLPPPKSRARPL
ncbi:hypothetical protein CI102_2539 [Trichoderma harzianum]|uniref:Uncharacterized protein n=1 Tax=Trichoderma harzianum CBS 226.95 TaxID=983964 RepID=A0A2T4AIR7_TRIHA|nr:hypothetical protein M431DRAFT_390550 [Trichoderma harzianum CBS 226.95]PKK51651.1 hypothetical protein CI102_2539 [Trichoderma harzianum]PTB56969.1 hypothetical protein M431DRAFT_390550 [Trichoderma harzianum CBS 226.95]